MIWVWAVFFSLRLALIFGLGHYISDLDYYHFFAARMMAGELPYRDFTFEYPPLAAAILWFPKFFAPTVESYRLTFRLFALIPDIMIAREVFRHPSVSTFGLRVAYVLVSALGLHLYWDRLDVWMTAGVVMALSTHVRARAIDAFLGLAVGIKLVPLILVPAFSWSWVRWLRVGLSLGVCMGLAAVLSRTNEISFLSYHLNRPLQIESTASVWLWFVSQWSGGVFFQEPLRVAFEFGSYNLVGGGASVFKGAFSVLWLGALFFTLFRVWRLRPDPAQSVLAFLLAFVTLGKVFSPQFMIWFVPVAFMIRDPRKRAEACLGVGLSWVLTQSVFLGYGAWLRLEAWAGWVLFLRSGILVLLWARLLRVESRVDQKAA